MALPGRLVLSVFLGGILLFCLFGFVATFEPLDPSIQLRMRLIYGFVGVLVLVGLKAVWTTRST
jgi:hypothetical protein